MRNKLITFSILFAFSCSTTKKVSFKVTDNRGQKFNYQMWIPKGYTIQDMNYENERTRIFLYSDSSRFFFSDNSKSSAFYPDAYKKYGKDINIKFLSADTITINGIDNAGKIWKERKEKNIVYGYMGVLPGNKKMFDSILKNVIIE